MTDIRVRAMYYRSVLRDEAAATTGTEQKLFCKGLNFIKNTDILLSGDKLTILVNTALDNCAIRVKVRLSL